MNCAGRGSRLWSGFCWHRLWGNGLLVCIYVHLLAAGGGEVLCIGKTIENAGAMWISRGGSWRLGWLGRLRLPEMMKNELRIC